MNRRNAFKYLSVIGLTPLVENLPVSAVTVFSNASDREFWVDVLTRIARPVLESLSQGQLKKNMPVECKPGDENGRRNVTHLEAFGRLMAGIAPWLELGADQTEEGLRRTEMTRLAQKSLKAAVDPQSADFMNFVEGGQPLVDAAFLSHAILRAPTVLWKQIDGDTQKQVIIAMKSSRVITPGYNNWLLFSAMVEAFLLFAGESYDELRMDYAIRKHMEWYKGDGVYGDGPDFHWDYYNSFVIQPMLIDILNVLINKNSKYEKTFETVLTRAKRYASIQEKLISPEGTFPPIGRSLPYRFGAFQLLAQLSLQHRLPNDLPPGQVRSALTAVIRKMMEAPGVFDPNDWLKIGFMGHQPDIAESYISTGSLYLCSVGLLPLGLPETDPFWASPFQDWTSKKIWSGLNFPADHAISE